MGQTYKISAGVTEIDRYMEIRLENLLVEIEA